MADSNNSERSTATSAESGHSGPSMMLILFGVLAVAVLVFILRNGDETEIDFMVFNWDTTVRWSIFIAIVLGVALDRLFLHWWRRRGKKQPKKGNPTA